MATYLAPVSKMGCQSIEVEVQAIAGEKGETAKGQHLSQGVDEQVGHMLRARTQLEHGKKLGARVDGQPQPEHLFGTAQPGSEFVQLQVREVQMAEEALVQRLSVLASASQPGGDGRLPVAEDPLGGGRVQSFGQRREHHDDLLRGRFQAIEGG